MKSSSNLIKAKAEVSPQSFKLTIVLVKVAVKGIFNQSAKRNTIPGNGTCTPKITIDCPKMIPDAASPTTAGVFGNTLINRL